MSTHELDALATRLTEALRARLPEAARDDLTLLLAAAAVLGERHGAAQPPTIH